MFEQLTQRLQATLKSLRGTVKVDDKTIDAAARDLRMALLEADVNYGVVKDFVGRVRERALGQEVLQSLTPGQQVVKVVRDEMVELLGGSQTPLELEGSPPHVLMIVGLQGAGKTTTTAKLGHWLRRQGRSPLLVSADVHRPAAREQLAQLAASADLAVHDAPGDDAVTLAREAMSEARRRGDDVLLIDTAGRLHVDEAMMEEAARLQESLQPEHVLYVADALAGQDALTAAESFDGALSLTGIVLTKLDGDARGGAALSVTAVTGKPVMFAGVGERWEDLEPFHPDRMASRILGMGDVLTLIEKAESAVDVEEAEALQEKVRRGEFTLEDFREQLQQVRKMGPLSQLFEMLPGAGAGLEAMAPGEEDLRHIEAIIDSMTVEERRKPQIVDGSRRRRIAAGSGTSVQDVNKLLKQFTMARKMMKRMRKGRGGRLDLAQIPGLGR